MLDKEVVIITGGLGYLGAHFVSAIKEAGGYPVITDIKAQATDTKDCLYFQMDITSQESIESVLKQIVEKYGKIDGVVNNAYPRNKLYGQKLEAVSYESFCENVNMHLGGYFLVSKIFSDFFRRQGYGNIVNISSIYGVIPPRFDIYADTEMTMPVEYAAIKSAVIHLTKYFSNYYRGNNIRFNSLSIGGILAGQPESFLREYKQYAKNKGMLEPQDIVGSLVFLLSKHSEYINGQNIIVDDGWSL